MQQAPAMAPATVVKAKPRTARNRVVVTGGAGFVGSHLCEYLVERGDYVRRALPAPPPSPPWATSCPPPARRCLACSSGAAFRRAAAGCPPSRPPSVRLVPRPAPAAALRARGVPAPAPLGVRARG